MGLKCGTRRKSTVLIDIKHVGKICASKLGKIVYFLFKISRLLFVIIQPLMLFYIYKGSKKFSRSFFHIKSDIHLCDQLLIIVDRYICWKHLKLEYQNLILRISIWTTYFPSCTFVNQDKRFQPGFLISPNCIWPISCISTLILWGFNSLLWTLAAHPSFWSGEKCCILASIYFSFNIGLVGQAHFQKQWEMEMFSFLHYLLISPSCRLLF